MIHQPGMHSCRPAVKFIRNANKDDLLLLPESDGEEGEAKAIREVSEAHAPALLTALAGLLAYVLGGHTAPNMLERANSLPREDLINAVIPLLVAGGKSAINIQASLLEGHGVAVPVAYAESQVAQWANGYSYDLVSGINQNSRLHLQRHISAWARSNEDLPALEARLAPWFGASRAELIASTEATRAFSEGTFTAWEGAGFNRRPGASSRPPAHPRCRCFPALEKLGNGWNYIWYTVNDDLVCPICEPRHLTVIGVAKEPERGGM